MPLDPTKKSSALIFVILSLVWGVVKFGGVYLLVAYIPQLRAPFVKILVSIDAGLLITLFFHLYLKKKNNSDVIHFTIAIIRTLLYWRRDSSRSG